MSDQVIGGRYELGARLGLGGMSTVRLAVDHRLHRNVAVKLLAEHLADDPSFVERFRREALAAARLVHPNIVQVFDFGLDEESGRHYIVMEHVHGQSGAEILRDRGHVGVEEALAIVFHACRGLDYAHRHDVVHRDVKPGNLLRADDGLVKLADFGIAKALRDDASAITQIGSVLGTAAYLAPEQARGHEAGPAADIYALGVVSYQLIAGRLPYEAASLTELALLQQQEAPPLLNELVAGVTPQLAAAVDRALALDPRDRFGGASEMRAAMADGARGVGPMPTDVPYAAAPPEEARTQVVPRRAGGERPAGRRLQPQPSRRPVAAVVRAPSPHAPAAPRRNTTARLAVLVTVLVLAVAAAALALNSSGGGGRAVQLRDVSGANAHDTAERLRELVDDNTR